MAKHKHVHHMGAHKKEHPHHKHPHRDTGHAAAHGHFHEGSPRHHKNERGIGNHIGAAIPGLGDHDTRNKYPGMPGLGGGY